MKTQDHTGRRVSRARHPARRGLVRSARALAAAALLAVLCALTLPATAQADVLVSNLGQPAISFSDLVNLDKDFLRAQAFSVPAGGGDHSLASIEIRIGRGIASSSFGSLSVSVWSADSSGHPDSSLYSLTNPSSSISANALGTFRAPADTTLEAGQTYLVVVYYDKEQANAPDWQGTESDDEDVSFATGWTIADAGLSRRTTETSWSDNDFAFGIRVNGTPPPNTAPAFSETSTTRTVPENSPVGTNVGAVVAATDTDSGDTLTYSLEGTDAASFDIDSGTGQIKTKTGVTYNHEATKNTYSVTVKADDGNSGTDTITVTISVTDVAEQPSKPAAPTVSAVSGSATSLTASWSAPGLNGGPALTGYEVQYRAGSGTWTGFGHSDTAVTTTITGLMADTSYQVQVRAENGETPSDWSDPSASVRTNDLPELSVANARAQEGNALTFTVTLSPASTATVTVRWAAASLDKAGNDAVAGTDYTAGSGTLTFGANETSKQVTVATREDTTDEEDETFTLTLSSPTNAALSNGLTELEALGTIENDDTPPVLSVADASAAEGSPVRFTVRLSAASGRTVTVNATTSIVGTDTATSDTDFTAVSSMTLTFAPGDTSKTVEVTTDDDALDEEDEETFTLTLSGASNATLSATNATAAGTIRDNDALPRITIGKATVNEGDGTIEVPLTLNTASAREVTAVWYVNTGGSFTAEDEDFAVNPTTPRTVRFPPGSVSEQIRIALVDDTTDEPDETFLVQLGGAVNATFANASNTVTIEDNDDPPTITIAGDVTQSESISGLELTINLSEASEKRVRFKIRRVDRPDDTVTVLEDLNRPSFENQFFPMSPGTTTVDRGWNYIQQDAMDEPDETFTLEIHAFENATAGAKTEATVTIEDDDDPPVVSVSDASADEGDPVEFEVSLSEASGKTVTVGATTSVGSGDTASSGDFTGVTETLTFAPGDEEKTVSVATDGDTTDEPDRETFTLTLSGGSNVSISTTAGAATGTIEDNDDAPEVTLVLTPSSIDESGSATSTTVTAELSNPSSEATTVTVGAAAVSPAVARDFALSTNRTLTIAAGATVSTGTVTIAANDNDTDAPDRRVTVSATATNTQDVAGNPDDEILTIVDDEASPAVTLSLSVSSIGEAGGTTVATASLSHPSSEATTVTLTPAADDFTVDNGGVLTITAGATQSSGSVTLTAVNDDTDAPDKELTVTASAVNTQGVGQPAGVPLRITDDEVAPVATLTVSASMINENGGTATVSVTAAGADAKAAAFTLTSATLTVPAGRTAGSSTATLVATDNEVDAPDQTVTIMARAENTQGIADNNLDDVTLTIEDDEAAPTVTLSLSETTIGEAAGETEVTAALSHPSSEVTTVTVSTAAAAVSPAAESDFVLSGSVPTIAAGDTTSTGAVTITAVDNDVDAADKGVTVRGQAENTQGLAGDPPALTLTIEDDDERGLAFSPAARTLSESEVAQNAYTVALTSEPTATVTLRVTSPGVTALGVSDASLSPILASWTLTFTPDDWDDPQALSLVAGADADSAPDTVQLRHAASGGDYGSVSENYAVTIADTDAPTRNIVLSVDRVEVPEGGGAQTLEVTARLDAAPLTSPASVAVTVGAGTAEAADFAASPATFNLTIAAGGFSASQTVTLTPVDDALVEGAETVAVSGTTTTTQEGTTTVLGVTGAEVTIADDDARGVTVAADDPLEVNEDGSASYTVVLDSEPEGEVTVTPEVTGDADVTVAPAVLTFTAATWDTAQRVTVSAADDDDTADDEAEVRHAVAGADYGANNVTADSVTVSVDDDDSQGVSVSVSRLTVPEGGSATYTVVLDSAPSGTVTVRPQATGDADVTVSPSSLRFTASNWSEMRTVTVTARADADSEDDTATVSHAVSGASGLAGRDVAVTVTDDDEASTGIMLTLSPERVDEGGGAKTVTVTAALNGAALTSDTDVSVQVRAGTGAGFASATDFTAVPAALVLTIRAGETEARGTFRLTPDDDDLDEGDGETVEVTGTAEVSGTTSILLNVLTIVDDDGRGLEVSRTALTVTEASSATYTVRLASLPIGPVEVAVSVADNPDVTVSPTELSFSVANWETRQTVTVSAAADPDGDADMATVMHEATGGGYDGITGSDVAVAVRDNDRASRTVQLAVEPATVEEDGGVVQVTVTATLDGAARATATVVALAATGGTAASGADFQALTGLTVTIPANETQGSATVTFTPVDDSLDEGSGETVTVGGSTEGLTVRAAELTIVDDDERGIEVSGGPLTLTEEADRGTDYTVRLASAPAGPVTVRVTVTGDRDVTVTPSSLAFTADDWERVKVVTVTAAHDDDASGDEAELRHAASGGDYRGVTGDAVAVAVTDDDAPGVTVSVTTIELREGGSGSYTVVLDTQPTGTVTVTPSLATGGDADITVTPARLSFTTSNWKTPKTVTVRAAQDLDQNRNNATVEHAVTGADYGEEDVTAAEVGVTVTDDDVASTTVNLSVSPETVREGAGTMSLTVTAELDGAPADAEVAVTLSLASGTAQSGTDFEAVDDVTLTIPPGAVRATARMTLTPVDDEIDGPAETKTVRVTGSAAGSLSVTPAELTIADDDALGLVVSRRAVRIGGNGEATYTVRLATRPAGGQDVTVRPALHAPPEVTLAPEVLRFTAVDWNVAQTVTVAAPPGTYRDNETAAVVYTVTGADYGSVAGGEVVVTLTYRASGRPGQTPVVSIADAAAAEGAGAMSVAVTLSAVSRRQVSVGWSTADGTAAAGVDYEAASGRLTFAAGETVKTIAVTLLDDEAGEEDETFTVTLAAPSNARLGDATATATIADDEARVTLAVSPAEVPEGGGAAEVAVTAALEAALERATEIAVAVSGGTAEAGADFAPVPEFTVTVPAGATEGTGTFALAPVDDAVDEGAGETVTVGGSTPGMAVTPAQVTIVDDDQPRVTLAVSPAEVPEGGGAAEVTVTAALEEAAAEPVAVTVTLADGTAAAGADFAPAGPVTVTIPAGSSSAAAAVAVTPVDDAVDEGAGETVTVAGSAPGFAVTPATLTLLDDDRAAGDDGRSPSTVLGLSAAVVPGGPVPLTARFVDGPSGHDGEAPFTIGLVFSEGVDGLFAAAVRDDVLGVTGGRVAGARLLAGSGGRSWELTVAPAGYADVSVTLAPTADCAAAGAVCTADGRKQSSRLSALVRGPVVVSVADARVREGAGATLDFAVRLSRARDAETRVDWATVDGTATAGADYRAASGTLVLAAGETSGTVSVEVLADAHDEGDETLTLRLSNPVGARLGDAEATGTISNTSAIPRAWLARFGRTVADQVLRAAADRLEGARATGTEVTLAGQRLGGAEADADADVRAAEARLAALRDRLRGEAGEDAGDSAGGWRWREVTGRDFLTGSSFALTGGSAAGGFGSLWGRGAISSFDGREGGLTLDGEVAGAMLGADWRVGGGTAGLLLSHARGEGGYREGGDCTDEPCAGEAAATLTGLYPYGRYAVSERVTVWGVAGYGAGKLTLEPAGQRAMEADTDLAMAAAGLRGVLVTAPDGGGVELAVKPDALWLRTTSEAVTGLAAAEAGVTRLRLGVEGTWRGLEAGSGRLVPSLELAVRHDGGDAETGFGADIGAGLAWSDAARGIEAKLGGRGLLTHEDGGLRERGLAASLAWDPAPGSDRGARLTLALNLGASASGGADALLARTTMAGLAANDDGAEPQRRRLEARFGYGFPVFADRFTWTPEIGVAFSEADRTYRLGWRLGLAGDGPVSLDLKLEGTRRQPLDGDPPAHGAALELNARW